MKLQFKHKYAFEMKIPEWILERIIEEAKARGLDSDGNIILNIKDFNVDWEEPGL